MRTYGSLGRRRRRRSYGMRAVERPTSGLAVAALALAIMMPPLGLVMALPALADTAGGRRGGRAYAVAAIWINVAWAALFAVLFAGLLAPGF